MRSLPRAAALAVTVLLAAAGCGSDSNAKVDSVGPFRKTVDTAVAGLADAGVPVRRDLGSHTTATTPKSRKDVGFKSDGGTVFSVLEFRDRQTAQAARPSAVRKAGEGNVSVAADNLLLVVHRGGKDRVKLVRAFERYGADDSR